MKTLTQWQVLAAGGGPGPFFLGGATASTYRRTLTRGIHLNMFSKFFIRLRMGKTGTMGVLGYAWNNRDKKNREIEKSRKAQTPASGDINPNPRGTGAGDLMYLQRRAKQKYK